MTRQEFMAKLAVGLGKMTLQERTDALSYYTDFFDEGGDEAEVCRQLGDPTVIAAQILEDAGYTSGEESFSGQTAPSEPFAPPPYGEKEAVPPTCPPGGEKGKGGVNPWVIVAIVLTFPLWIGLAAGAMGTVFGLFVAMFALVFAGCMIIVSGVLTILAGFAVLMATPMTTLFLVGVGLVLMGLGILLVGGMSAAIRGFFGLIRMLCRWIAGMGRRVAA